MLPQHLVYKNELNREYVITLARNDENHWWWSEKIETCRSGFKCFKVFFLKWKLCRCICWLIVEVILRNARCNDEIHKSRLILSLAVGRIHQCKDKSHWCVLVYPTVKLRGFNLNNCKFDFVNFVDLLLCTVDRGSSVGNATRYGLAGPGIESRFVRDFPHSSRSALGPIQPLIQWLPDLCLG